MRHAALVMVVMTGIAATTAAAPAGAGDPFVGTWKLDAAKSKGTDAMTPQREIIAAAANGYTIHEVTQIRAGSQQTADMDVVLDGKPHDVPVQGATETQAFHRSGPNAIDGSITVNGQPFGTETLSVSADGKTLTITQAGPAGSGGSLTRVYDKQ